MWEFSLVVLDCPEDWTCDWLGGNQVIGPLEAPSFSIAGVLTANALRISHIMGLQEQSGLNILLNIFSFSSSAPSGSKWHCFPVGDWFGIIWTAVVPWADSPTVFDSKGTKQSDR